MRWTTDQMHVAAEARDARFDGLFFICVTSTKIYCRPVCPVKAPMRANRRFAPSAAAAEAAGFRPCLRCCPERAPGMSPMDSTSRLASKAVARIEAGAMDDGTEERLAAHLAVTPRHLRRVVKEHVGATPISLAQTRRLLAAKQLLAETDAPIIDVAYAAGFASLRRFNAAFLERYGLNPSTMRRARAAPVGSGIRLRLAYRPPFDLDAQFNWLAGRAIPGVERVEGHHWQRTVQVGARSGVIGVAPLPGHEFEVRLSENLLPALRPLLARVRALFDLDADMTAIDGALGAHPLFTERVAARPGIRVPVSFDGFEGLVRTILGQQVSVAAARTFAGRLAEKFGAVLVTQTEALHFVFPNAAALAAAGPDGLQSVGLTGARARTLHGVAEAVATGLLDLDSKDVLATFRALQGIGVWTQDYVAMRVLGDPDVFPGTDLVLRQRLGGQDAAFIARLSEAWAPWRAYAAQRLWMQEA